MSGRSAMVFDEVVDEAGPGRREVRGPAGRWRVTATVEKSGHIPIPAYSIVPRGAASASLHPRWPDVPATVEVDVPAGVAELTWGWPHQTRFVVEVVA